MKLWHISQEINNGYNTFDSAVVAAESEEQARNIHPSEYYKWNNSYPYWANSPKQVRVCLIGEASTNVRAGVICASFNAG